MSKEAGEVVSFRVSVPLRGNGQWILSLPVLPQSGNYNTLANLATHKSSKSRFPTNQDLRIDKKTELWMLRSKDDASANWLIGLSKKVIAVGVVAVLGKGCCPDVTARRVL